MIRSLLDPTLFQQYDAMRRGESPMGQGGLLSGPPTLGAGTEGSTLGAPTPPPAPRPMAAPPPAAAGAAAAQGAPTPSMAFRNALLAGGQAASQAPAYDSVGSSIVSALANGITSGAQAFSATRDAEADRDAKLAALQAQKAAEAEKARLIASGIGAFQAGDRPAANFPVPMDAGPMAAPGGFDVNIPGRDALQAAVAAAGTQAPEVLKALEPQIKARGDLALQKQKDEAEAAAVLAAGFNVGTGELAQGLSALNITPKKPGQYTQDEARRLHEYFREANKAKGTNILTTMGGKAADVIVTKTYDSLMTMKEAVETARVDASAARRQLALIRGPLGDDNGIINGTLAPARVEIAKFISTVSGIPDDRLAATQAYAQTAMTRALPYIRLLAPVTEQDYKAMIAWKGGEGSFPAASARRIIEADIKLADILEKRYNQRIQGPEGRMVPGEVRPLLDLPPDLSREGEGAQAPASGDDEFLKFRKTRR